MFQLLSDNPDTRLLGGISMFLRWVHFEPRSVWLRKDKVFSEEALRPVN
jgi:hypothetical protein